MTDFETIVLDAPLEGVCRITLNRPEKRNAISTVMRTELLMVLESNDRDPDVRVTVIRGGGTCFSAGYDLAGADSERRGGAFAEFEKLHDLARCHAAKDALLHLG